MKQTNRRRNPGFTLAELLVSVSIIALISSTTVAGFANVLRRARDVKRLADMEAIQTALEGYKADHGEYPPNDDNDCAGWDTTSDGLFIPRLVSEGYLDNSFQDPLNSTGACAGHGSEGFNYFYYRYPPGLYNCSNNFNNYYVLGIGDLETTGRPSPVSPGWACSGRDWEATLEWATGQYEG
ncbi:MAG: type II secretion system GspH family protein [Candidatus Roizmanbacteria bacterium]|nr:type II secretion system GspH family protein [Candidatus Roizmanbacteria bacterium]